MEADKRPNAGQALRRQAEALVQQIENIEALSADDPRRMLHELQVHQVELEMQNEDLRRIALSDITERRQNEEALHESLARFRNLLQDVETGLPVPASEASLMRKDGSRVTVLTCHAIVQVPGQPQELFCMEALLENTERAMRKVSPHNPLYDDLKEIRQAAEQAAALTCQLLAFASQEPK